MHDWATLGPIIERERIEISPNVNDDGWSAWIYGRGTFHQGATPLDAARRAYIALRERRQVPRCEAYQCSDQMLCGCGLAWDVNDPEPPACGRATIRDRVITPTGTTK